MKLFNAIAAVTVIGASFVAASPAQARNGWIKVGTSGNGSVHYIKPRGCSGSMCFADERYTGDNGFFTAQWNCSTWNYRFVAVDGKKVKDQWRPIMPESVAEAKAEIACR